MTVADIMTQEVVTIRMDDHLGRVKVLFEKTGFHHVPVKDKGVLVGVLSDRDLLRHISPFLGSASQRSRDEATLKKRVHQIMSRDLVIVAAETPVAEAAKIMLEEKVSCLPVVSDEGKLLGLVTSRDMLKWVVQEAGAG